MPIFREHALAHQLLDGFRGLEIGAAAHNPFGLDTRNVAPADDYEFYANHQAEAMEVTPATVDIWARGDRIPVPDNSEDFVLSSHVVEHLPNLVAAFVEWDRIVRVGGYIFMIVPHREALSADITRPVTTLGHFIDDYRKGHTLDTHPTEDVPGGRMGHYHVFTPDLVLQLVEWMRDERLCDWQLVAREDVDTKVGNGFTLAFRIASKSARDVRRLPCPSLTLTPELTDALGQTEEKPGGKVVGLFGTFEVDNYGDRLFPILLERALQQRLPGLRTRLFSPGDGTYGFDGRRVHSVADLEQHAEDLDGFVIGGGDIIRFDPVHGRSEAPATGNHADLVVLPSALGRLRGQPVVWNGPGIPHPLTSAEQAIIEGAASMASLLAVRDEVSRSRLGREAARTAVVPDTGLLLADVFPLSSLARVMESLRRRLALTGDYVTVHLSPATARDEDWAEASEELAALSCKLGLPILLLPLGPVHGERARLRELRDRCSRRLLLVEEGLHPLEIAALIGHAAAFLGTSLHGNITAFAYGVPSVAVNSCALAKLDRFGELTGRPVLSSWRDLPQLPDIFHRPSDEDARRAAIRRQLEKHLSAVAAALGAPLTREQPAAGTWLPLLRGLSEAVKGKDMLQNVCRRVEGALQKVRQQLAVAEARTHESQRETDDLRRLIDLEHNHLGWQLLQLGRRLRNSLCPRGSWRWRTYLAARAPLSWLVQAQIRSRLARLFGPLRLLRKLNGLSWRQRRRMRARIRQFRYRPLISLLVPVYNVEEVWLHAMIQSVRRQVYPHWELCLVNDGSTAAGIRPALDRFAELDPRVRVKHLAKNEGISGATNHCLSMATGEFCVLLDHDDELAPGALFEVAAALDADPTLDLLYSDEDKVSAFGNHSDPALKPGWNPSLLLTCNYVSHMGVYRTSLLREVGGFRSEFDGSQDYDLVLRFTERTQRVTHLPKVLYHWRMIDTSTASSPSTKPHAFTAARRAVTEAMRRRGCRADVETRSPGQYRVRTPVPSGAAVSVVVHWPEATSAAASALRELIRLTGPDRAGEIILVLPEDVDPRLEDTGRVRTLHVPSGQPVARDLNAAAALARGEYLAFLDAGTWPLDGDWLEALLEPMGVGVAAVGARVLAPNGRLLHSGLVVQAGRLPVSSHAFLDAPSINRVFYTEAVRNCSAVGGGCLLVRRSAFEEVGGFDEDYLRDYHDVDLCLRLRARGGLVNYTPWAVLQQTVLEEERPGPAPEDQRLFKEVWWAKLPRRDPFFHHGLTRGRAA
jgi:glycosyltransferase involved in cell wall biosynthesis/polysaccharide pyruvyl transferase WcaK-like protein/SAM-dependent methyltransferase